MRAVAVIETLFGLRKSLMFIPLDLRVKDPEQLSFISRLTPISSQIDRCRLDISAVCKGLKRLNVGTRIRKSCQALLEVWPSSLQKGATTVRYFEDLKTFKSFQDIMPDFSVVLPSRWLAFRMSSKAAGEVGFKVRGLQYPHL